MSVSATDYEFKDIIEKALVSEHPLVELAVHQEQFLRKRTELELEELLSKTVAMFANLSTEQINTLKKAVLEQVALDIELVKKLNESLKSYKASVKPSADSAIYPLKFNKLALILLATQAFLEKYFKKLFEYGEIPKGYRFATHPTEMTQLGSNKYRIYGDGKGSVLSTAILVTYLVSTRQTFSNLALACNKETRTGRWINATALAHVAPLPESLSLDDKFTFCYIDAQGHKTLVYTYMRYAYGGDRGHPLDDKLCGPHDCTSWLEEICCLESFVTTVDFRYHYQQTCKINSDSPDAKLSADIPEAWLFSTGQSMAAKFDVVMLPDDWKKTPEKYILPGQIYVKKTHAMLVLGARKNGDIETMSYSRDLPETDGFGHVVSTVEPDAKPILFSLKANYLAKAKLLKEKLLEFSLLQLNPSLSKGSGVIKAP